MANPTVAGKQPIMEKVEPGTYFWCACGESQNQPYCDGSHKGTDFTPIKKEVTEAKRMAWCTCKQSSNAPLCDGSHNQL